ncbi:NADAR family protein [uncultured Aquimarina sp.]|uniref:NADAR family protein n=1 Tax=uncultured Aquimarina sp. TaxID=575652 RepID=UPI0026312209|nr:NADAR family protein [uncultured Aquimarina sp.]
MKYTLQNIQEEFNKGKSLKYLFFWGHTPNKDGSISKSCFSQWWNQSFAVEGVVYKTAEHWMMAEKARLFKDDLIEKEIIDCNHPMEAKQLGRKVRNFDPKIWDAHKYEIVKQGNYHKFSQHQELKEFLLNTKKRIIVEASPRDRIWGIGMGQANEKAQNPNLWRGQNLLGFALMEVRDELMK